MVHPDRQPFDFDALDDLVLAHGLGSLPQVSQPLFCAKSIGPLVELQFQSLTSGIARPRTSPWIALGPLGAAFDQLASGDTAWQSASKDTGIWLLRRGWDQEATEWIAFGVDLQKAANAAGLGKAAGLCVGAVEELLTNIVEHSGRPSTGLVAYQRRENCFEFAVADAGIGLLASLQQGAEYKALATHSQAISTALADGKSRHGSGIGRGKGFRPIFVGLADLNSNLRFRTGDHALIFSGANPSVTKASLAQKAPITGFFASAAWVT